MIIGCISNWIRIALAIALLAALTGWSSPVDAQSIVVGAGSSWVAGDADYDLGCHDLINHGDMNLGSSTFTAIDNFVNTDTVTAIAATLNVGGNWTNSGTFDAGSSVVRLTDDCGDATVEISGETTFPTLAIMSAMGKLVRFPAGATQTVTDALLLQGVSGNLLRLRSTQDGQQAFIALANDATQSIVYVDVADHAATGQVLAPGEPEEFFSVDSGNNFRWFQTPAAAPAPAMSSVGTLLLVMVLIGVAWIRLFGGRRRSPLWSSAH